MFIKSPECAFGRKAVDPPRLPLREFFDNRSREAQTSRPESCRCISRCAYLLPAAEARRSCASTLTRVTRRKSWHVWKLFGDTMALLDKQAEFGASAAVGDASERARALSERHSSDLRPLRNPQRGSLVLYPRPGRPLCNCVFNPP